jgi:hypothetical protein
MNKSLAYSLLLLSSVAGADTAKPEPKKPEPKKPEPGAEKPSENGDEEWGYVPMSEWGDDFRSRG